MSLVPRTIRAHERTWTVGRAWPAADGGSDLEVTAPGVEGVRVGSWRDGVVEIETGLHDRRLPSLADWATRGEIVSWRRGRRAVVRVGDEYVKIVRPAAASSVVAAHVSAETFRRGFAVPEVIGSGDEQEQGVVRLSRLPGRTLCELGADTRLDDAVVERAWNAWAEGWERVLGSGAGTVAGSGSGAGSAPGRRHTGADECAVLQRWVGDAAGFARDGDDLRRRADRLTEQLGDDSGATFVASHRDLHDKQVLVADDGRVGLLDLDTATEAEPALDLGNLRAHVAWRGVQNRLSAARAVIARGAIDRVARSAGIDAERLDVYEAATRMRLGAVYVFRPAWRDAALTWLDGATQMSR
ncbi:hypothetical protein MN032_00830 [Agromyces atrinae]|uniref:phosphotransferase family protein n=1 Tax=Agromyces atrinae TaxID=592376 RepID=UPI001F59504B|nr:hypothetical protein [Agromyces atrinae]MCI2956218.1 hypothetical protein [Agromyces atrinae]